MDIRRLVLIVVGALMIVVGFVADLIGVGPNPGVGWKQIVLIVLGCVVVVVGFALGGKSNAAPDEAGTDDD